MSKKDKRGQLVKEAFVKLSSDPTFAEKARIKVLPSELETVVIVHDVPGVAEAMKTQLEPLLQEHQILTLTSMGKAFMSNDVWTREPVAVIIHKDLGDPAHNNRTENWSNAAEDLVNLIHQRSTHTRVVIISGEYPQGKKHVTEMKVDAYIDTTAFSGFESELTSIVSLIKRGFVSPEEINQRGKEVNQPCSNLEGRGSFKIRPTIRREREGD